MALSTRMSANWPPPPHFAWGLRRLLSETLLKKVLSWLVSWKPVHSAHFGQVDISLCRSARCVGSGGGSVADPH